MKKTLKAAMVIIGAMTPFLAQADQPMNSANAARPATYTAGEKVKDGQLPAGYNQSADYMLNNGWDVYFTGNFVYWHLNVHEEAMGTLITPTSSSSNLLVNGSGSQVFVTPSYKPGFQVGMGFNMHGMDDWSLYGEYTWYKNSASHSVTPDSDQEFVLATGPVSSRLVAASSATGSNTFLYNNAELSLQRAFYWGKKLTSKFSCGLRGRWINQGNNVSATGLAYGALTSTSLSLLAETGSYATTLKQNSWALGPRFELDTNWLLGCGFRIMGDVAASVLYNKYTTLTSSLVEGSYANYADNNSGRAGLAPVTETALGLGWGSYFGDNNDFHFDLSAAYEFNVHWSQSYTRSLSDAPGNIYIHGLNVAARFDF